MFVLDTEECFPVAVGTTTVRRCYKYYSTPRQWEQARQVCDDNGGQLMTIPNVEFIFTVVVTLTNKAG